MASNQSCSSPATIKKAIELLCKHNDASSDGVAGAVSNLNAVLKSHGSNGHRVPVYRTVDEFEKECRPSQRLSYDTGVRLRMPSGAKFHDEMKLGNCHDGQTKLTLGLLEFLQRACDSNSKKKRKMHLLYVGASSVAANAAMITFPEIRQTNFDPAPNFQQLMPASYRKKALVTNSTASISKTAPIVAITAFFEDDTPKVLRSGGRFAEDEVLLFVSDIRLDDTSETAIVGDMLTQQRWAQELKCDWFMFKFRIPFERELVARYSSKSANTKMQYLSGDLVIQPYSPVSSAELRLIGKRCGNGLRSKLYDVEKIENLVFAHNIFWRGNAVFEGGVSPYDLAAERKILSRLDGRAKLAIDAYRKAANKETAAKCALGKTKKHKPKSVLGNMIVANCAKK